jgi:hypothetical protein
MMPIISEVALGMMGQHWEVCRKAGKHIEQDLYPIGG